MMELFPLDDAHFEARKGGLEIKEPEDLICESKNRIVKMCISPACTKKSLFCDKNGCPSCPTQEHGKCPKAKLK